MLEADAGLMAELARKLAGVDGVAVIVAGSVGDIADQRTAGFLRGSGAGWKARGKRRGGGECPVDDIADQADDVAIVALISTPDIVGLADTAPLDHLHQRRAMIGNVEPVADVGAVAIDRQL